MSRLSDLALFAALATKVKNLTVQLRDISRQPGPRGLKGERGLRGLQGPRGIAGKNGTSPPKAKDGARGKPGKDGADGEDGEQGPIGPMPKHKWVNTTLTFEKAPGKWGKGVDLQGPPGKGGGVVIGGGAGFDPSGAPLAETIVEGDEMLLVRAGKLMRIKVSLSETPTGNAVVVDGVRVVVDGQFVVTD